MAWRCRVPAHHKKIAFYLWHFGYDASSEHVLHCWQVSNQIKIQPLRCTSHSYWSIVAVLNGETSMCYTTMNLSPDTLKKKKRYLVTLCIMEEAHICLLPSPDSKLGSCDKDCSVYGLSITKQKKGTVFL